MKSATVSRNASLTSGVSSPSANLKSLERVYWRLVNESDTLHRLIGEADARQSASLELSEALTEAQQILQNLEGAWRREFEKNLAALVSHGLTAVFGEPLALKVENRVVRDVLATELSLVRGAGTDAIETPVLGASGGSVVNVLSLLLRVLLVISARPPLRRILILDEALEYLDEYSMPAAVGTLIRELAERLDLQFIIVSHEPALVEAADRAYEVTRGVGEATAKIKLIKDRTKEHA